MTKARGTKNSSEFVSTGTLHKKEASGLMSHATEKAIKPPGPADDPNKQKHKNLWFKKYMGSDSDALKIASREVVAQELFRLFIPNQPKTRLVIDGSDIFVASKSVEGFIPLEKLESDNPGLMAKNLLNHTFKGLGDVVVIALLLHEIDLKLGNMGLNKNNEFIKIDGDWCFARLRKPDHLSIKYRNQITEGIINELPYPGNYGTHNWLQVISQGKYNHSATTLTYDLCVDDEIRSEINRSILKALMMPDQLIKKFISHYVSDSSEIDVIYNEYVTRKTELKNAALMDNSFLAYMQTTAAHTQAQQFVAYVDSFKLTKKDSLLDTDKVEKAKQHGLMMLEYKNVKQQSTDVLTLINAVSSAAPGVHPGTHPPTTTAATTTSPPPAPPPRGRPAPTSSSPPAPPPRARPAPTTSTPPTPPPRARVPAAAATAAKTKDPSSSYEDSNVSTRNTSSSYEASSPSRANIIKAPPDSLSAVQAKQPVLTETTCEPENPSPTLPKLGSS